MKNVKRILCIVLSVIILSFSVGTSWFDSNHMEKVEATGVEEIATIALSAAAMYAICYYVGTVAYTYAPIETQSLSDTQITSTGYALIQSAYLSGALNNPALMSAPIVAFLDKAGQSYLYGTEAIKEVAETELTVIMGGKKPDNDDNNNDDDDTTTDNQGGIVDNVVHMFGNVKELSACVSLVFGGVLGSIIKDEYNNYMNGDESIYSEWDSTFVTSDDIHKQWSGTTYNASIFLHNTYTYKSPYESVTHSYIQKRWFNTPVDFPMAVYHYTTVDASGMINHFLFPIRLYNGKVTTYWKDDYVSTWVDGKQSSNNVAGSGSWSWDYNDYGTWSTDYIHNLTCSLSGNIPIFSTKIAAETYLKNYGEGYENALNYVKPYHIADWLSSDWSGTLLDPLTGLQGLSNLSNIARHQGLNALGDSFNFSQFADFLRDYFANLGTNILPEVDPSQAPIVYPVDTPYPDYTYDPSINPAIKPSPSTGTNPTTPTDPDLGNDPIINPTPNPDTTYPIDDIVPDSITDFSDISGNLEYKFPFCIPWDIHYLFTVLADTPKTPIFRLPLYIERYDIHEEIVIDMSQFEVLSKISRLFFSLLYVYGLINWTVKIVSIRKEE